MKTSVLIPTYCRTEDLSRCLAALDKQTCQPDEVIVVVRDIDIETQCLLQGLTSNIVRQVIVTVTGQVAALNVGIQAATGEVIAITDDDACPHPTWLQHIQAVFLSDRQIGGVGGRDWVYVGNQLLEGAQENVGMLQWFGRVVGNHHIGIGSAREVDILKGANMSYRRKAIEALRFDDRLKGNGAQVHNDLAFSLAVKRRGWKLIYDPAIAVNHYPAQRFDDDQRGILNPTAIMNQTHNEVLAVLDNLTFLPRLAFLVWGNIVGTRSNLGLLQVIRLVPQEGIVAIWKGWFCFVGRLQGILTWATVRFL